VGARTLLSRHDDFKLAILLPLADRFFLRDYGVFTCRRMAVSQTSHIDLIKTYLLPPSTCNLQAAAAIKVDVLEVDVLTSGSVFARDTALPQKYFIQHFLILPVALAR
jgi:hypothetical protein